MTLVFRLGNWDKVEEDCQRALELDKYNTKAGYLIGLVKNTEGTISQIRFALMNRHVNTQVNSKKQYHI